MERLDNLIQSITIKPHPPQQKFEFTPYTSPEPQLKKEYPQSMTKNRLGTFFESCALHGHVEKIKESMSQDVGKILEGLRNLNRELEIMDSSFKKYYEDDEDLMPMKNINNKLLEDFCFYRNDQGLSNRKKYKVPMYDLVDKKKKLPSIKTKLAERNKIILEQGETHRPVTSNFEDFSNRHSTPILRTTPSRELLTTRESFPTSASTTARNFRINSKYVMMDKQKLPINLYMTSVRRRGIIKEIKNNKKGLLNEEQIQRKVHQVAENDEQWRQTLYNVEKEMLYKQRESILSKNPYGNTLYQLLALPKEQRARVIKKLDGRYTGDLNIK